MEQFDRLPDIFADALECDVATRSDFLVQACGGDQALLARASELIAHAGAAGGGFLEAPAFAFGAEELAAETGGELKPGETLGDYRVVSLLGEGGMGEVYLAEDTRLERQVALKLLKRHLREALGERFEHERRVLAGLTHPGIARLYNAAQTEGRAYLVMEYVEGERIDVYCDRLKLTTDERLALFRQVCAAVAYAHQHLVIHRDLKPANIRVTPEGEPKLLDFGIAKLVDPLAGPDDGQTVSQFVALTPEYASPEQWRGEPITTASDIYNLGLLLYELLSGRRPYAKVTHSREGLERAACEMTAPRPSSVAASEAAAARRGTIPARLSRQLAGDLDNIVLKAMRFEPARRYPSVSQLSDDLLRRLERRPVSARKETLLYVGTRFIARNKALTAAALTILLTLVGGIVGTSWQAHVANEARRTADAQRRLAQRRFEDVRRLADSLMFEIHDSVQDLAGSTPTRKLIVTRALEYLDSLSKDADTPALRRDLAIAYRKVGDVQGNPYSANLGDTEGSMASYRKAGALLQSIGSQSGDQLGAVASSDVQMELGKVYRALGDLLEVKGDVAGMVQSYRHSLDIFEQLDRAKPGDAAVLDELARAYETLGEGLEHGDNAHAEQVHCYERMLALDQRAAAAAPDNSKVRRSLAIAFLKLGGITLEDQVHGIADLSRSVDLLKTLSSENPDSGRARRDYAMALYTRGWGRSELGQPAAATPDFEQALAIREQIATADAKDEQARYDVAVAHSNLAEALTNSGQAGNALDHAQQAVTILKSMMPADPDNTSYIRNCGFFYEKLAHAHAALASQDLLDPNTRTGHWRDARAAYQEALALFADLVAKGASRAEDRDLPGKLAAAISDCDQRLADLRK